MRSPFWLDFFVGSVTITLFVLGFIILQQITQIHLLRQRMRLVENHIDRLTSVVESMLDRELEESK